MAFPDRFDIPAYLGRLPLFNALQRPELERLAAGTTLHRVARGDMVFRVGEPCEALHIAVDGRIKLFMLSPAGQEKVLEIVGPGQTFAEALMFMGRPYIVNAQALTDAVLLSVAKQTVVHEIHADPRIAMSMLAGISARLHGLVRDVEAYSLLSGVQRVIGYLLRDRHDDVDPGAASGPGAQALTVSLPVSKATVASRLSLTPEYFSRVLHELETAGLIEVDRRDIRIPDARRLAAYGQTD